MSYAFLKTVFINYIRSQAGRGACPEQKRRNGAAKVRRAVLQLHFALSALLVGGAHRRDENETDQHTNSDKDHEGDEQRNNRCAYRRAYRNLLNAANRHDK